MRTVPLLLLLLATECGDPPSREPARRLLEEHHVAGYTVRVWGDVQVDRFLGGLLIDKCYWPKRMEILVDGVRLYSDEAYSDGGFRVGNWRARDDATFPPGRDLTGNGRRNLVISRNNGSAKSRVDLLLFELEPRLRLVTTLGVEWADARFTDLDGDGVPEVVTQDHSYAYWPSCFAASPRPRVVLRFAGDRYVAAPDLMRRELVFADVRERVATVLAVGWESWHDAPDDLWACPLDLMYSGNGALARRFIDAAWPPGVEGREEFVAELERQVSESCCRDAVAPLGD